MYVLWQLWKRRAAGASGRLVIGAGMAATVTFLAATGYVTVTRDRVRQRGRGTGPFGECREHRVGSSARYMPDGRIRRQYHVIIDTSTACGFSRVSTMEVSASAATDPGELVTIREVERNRSEVNR